MDAPMPNSYPHPMENSSTAAQTSPPGSNIPSPRTLVPPPSNPFALAPAGRAPGLAAPSPQLGSRSPGGYTASPYSRSYRTSSTSPSAGSGGQQEAQSNEGAALGPTAISPTQISSASLNAQKRAYRQRRKDPSCDACRERKVKCDATETSACSECSSRNHKCQFTKETNRRMSSIKQVQDLQSQLAELKQENTQLRTKATVRGADADREQAPVVRQIDPHGPGLDIRKLPAPSLTNFDHVRRNIQVHSHNIFKTPATSTATSHSNVGALDLPDIPARADFAYLSQAYFESTHELYPVLHWPTFKREVDQVYTSRSFQGMSSDWIALFFTVLACGSLQASMVAPGSPKGPDAGIKYFETATRLLVSWIQDFSLNYARAAFILSVFAMEGNKKSAGSVWLATAIRAAQELGLNLDTDHHPRFESEMGRRLWWALYVRDRITSLGANCSMLINEDDCKLPLPSSTDDRYVESPTSPRRSAAYSPFVCVIHVTRLFSELYQVLKASIIKPHVFQNYDEKFHSSFAVLPEPYHPRSESYLDPSGLSAVLALQFARYQLYRRNMSPVCTSAERSEALHRCASAAQETAKYISRTRKGPNPNAEVERNWRNKVAQIASNMICMHLWRCIMMLCLQGDYYAASSCCLLSSTIGDIREINTACGKNLVFFLDRLVENRRSGSGGMHHLEHDEEMLAYVSGDMQGNLEHSWVWAGGDLAPSQTSPHTSPHGRNRTLGADEPMQGIHLPLRSNLGSSESGTREWEGWSRIERTIRHLMEESRPRPSSYYPTPHNPVKRVQLAPEVPTSPSRSGPAPSPTPSSTSRISIANII